MRTSLMQFCCFWVILFSACGPEKRLTRISIKYKDMVQETALYFVHKYQNSGKSEIFLNTNDSVGSKYRNFLRKLGTPWIQVNFNSGEHFITADSVVLFTRTGIPILGNEHDILYDFKTTPRQEFISRGSFEKCYKLSNRIFYIKAGMPVF